MKVRIQDEVLAYIRTLPPEPRHALRIAIKALQQEKGDIKSLVDDLNGFHRLRVGSHRIIFEYEMLNGARTITCVFADPRKWIYEVFQTRLRE